QVTFDWDEYQQGLVLSSYFWLHWLTEIPVESYLIILGLRGSSVGIAFTYAVSGYIIDSYGWEYVFYMQAILGTIGVGITILVISFSGCNVMLAVSMLILAVTLQGTIPAGPMAKIIDMSPNFSGVLQGISGTLSVLSGFIGPILVGHLTQNNQITFDWDENEQDSILGSFFWIHWVSQLPSGILTHYYGTKVVFGMAILLGAVSNILIPFAAKMGVTALIAVRLFQGFVGVSVTRSRHRFVI
ncbi:hypothetical protein U1Q18_051262, partial [Sarracenia purpurea var. burkii]